MTKNPEFDFFEGANEGLPVIEDNTFALSPEQQELVASIINDAEASYFIVSKINQALEVEDKIKLTKEISDSQSLYFKLQQLSIDIHNKENENELKLAISDLSELATEYEDKAKQIQKNADELGYEINVETSGWSADKVQEQDTEVDSDKSESVTDVDEQIKEISNEYVSLLTKAQEIGFDIEGNETVKSIDPILDGLTQNISESDKVVARIKSEMYLPKLSAGVNKFKEELDAFNALGVVDTNVLNETDKVDEGSTKENEFIQQVNSELPAKSDKVINVPEKSVGNNESEDINENENEGYKDKREHWGVKDEYRQKQAKYNSAVEAYYQENSWTAKGRNAMHGVGRLFGFKPELPEALKAMKKDYEEIRSKYVNSMDDLLALRASRFYSERDRLVLNNDYSLESDKAKIAFGKKFILEPNEELLKLQERNLLSPENQERLQKTLALIKKHKWATRIAFVAGAGTFATVAASAAGAGAVGMAIAGGAGAGVRASKIAASVFAGAGAGYATKRATQGMVDTARQKAEQAKANSLTGFSKDSMNALSDSVMATELAKNNAENRQKVAVGLVGVAAGVGVGINAPDIDELNYNNSDFAGPEALLKEVTPEQLDAVNKYLDGEQTLSPEQVEKYASIAGSKSETSANTTFISDSEIKSGLGINKLTPEQLKATAEFSRQAMGTEDLKPEVTITPSAALEPTKVSEVANNLNNIPSKTVAAENMFDEAAFGVNVNSMVIPETNVPYYGLADGSTEYMTVLKDIKLNGDFGEVNMSVAEKIELDKFIKLSAKDILEPHPNTPETALESQLFEKIQNKFSNTTWWNEAKVKGVDIGDVQTKPLTFVDMPFNGGSRITTDLGHSFTEGPAINNPDAATFNKGVSEFAASESNKPSIEELSSIEERVIPGGKEINVGSNYSYTEATPVSVVDAEEGAASSTPSVESAKPSINESLSTGETLVSPGEDAVSSKVEVVSGNYVIQKGDTLWDITKNQLASKVEGLSPIEQNQIIDKLVDNIKTNPELMKSVGIKGDVDLIRVGERLNTDVIAKELNRLVESTLVTDSVKSAAPLTVEPDLGARDIPIGNNVARVVAEQVDLKPENTDITAAVAGAVAGATVGTDKNAFNRFIKKTLEPVETVPTNKSEKEKSSKAEEVLSFPDNVNSTNDPKFKKFVEQSYGSLESFNRKVDAEAKKIDKKAYDITDWLSGINYESPFTLLSDMTLDEVKEFDKKENNVEVRNILEESRVKYTAYRNWIDEISNMQNEVDTDQKTTVADLFGIYLAKSKVQSDNNLVT
jgi:hypothetical protein